MFGSKLQESLHRVFVTNTKLLGAFAKFRKATVSFVVSVRPEKLGSHWADFHEI
jgi:hypothetical protein